MARRKMLRIATFNVNGIGTRLPQLLDWLHRESPDVVALQELKATDAALPASALEEAGYGALWQGEARWNGVALLARGTTPVESRRRLPGEPATPRAATWRRRRMALWWVHSTCPTAIRSPGPGSTTSCAGWSA